MESISKNLIIFLTGDYYHRNVKNINYVKSLQIHIINPCIKANLNVIICVGCYEHQKKGWEDNLSKNINIPVYIFTNIPDEKALENEYNRFYYSTHVTDKYRYMHNYGKQYYTYTLLRDLFEEKNINIDYILRTRIDIIYCTNMFFQPNWLENICDKNIICHSASEFHGGPRHNASGTSFNRWADRTNDLYLVCDQFIFGNLFIMDKLFKLYKCDKILQNSLNSNTSLGIECIIANYYLLNNIKVAAVELCFLNPSITNCFNENNLICSDAKPLSYIKYFN